MANEHFFPGDYFSSSSAGATGAAYAPGVPLPGLDVSAAAAYGMPSWAVSDQMMMMMVTPAVADSAAAGHFDSALSSLVSSPGGGGGLVNGDDMAIGDLIGRLGSICNGASANNSCYSTPLSSPPRGPPASVAAFRGYAGALETGRLSRVSSSKSLGAAAEADMSPTTANPATMPDKPPSKPAAAAGDIPARKRKSSAKGKATSSSLPAATAATNASPKRSKMTGDDEDAAPAAEEKPEPTKDYIHVRARRGQATDSHSLAERVRRERISERMKLLQSLVPGCNKITGKALMLDEIINYVQSLQRQVEFLSMKLATMNPQLDFDSQYLPSKDMNHMAIPGYPSGDPTTATTFSYTGSPATADPFSTYSCWDLDFHTVMQIGGTATGLSQDGLVAAMATSPSPLPHHPPAPRGFHGGGGQQQQGTTVNHMKAEP